MDTIRLIFRDNKLSVIQSQELTSSLKGHYFSMVPKKDSVNGSKQGGLYNDLYDALFRDEADVAVHPAKDLPFPLDEGLEVMALSESISTKDVLISRNKTDLKNLPEGYRVGVDTILRKEQLLAHRPDLTIVEVKGSIEQNLSSINAGDLDAFIASESNIKRLEFEHHVSEVLPFKTHPLQGQLVVIALKEFSNLKSIFYPIDVRRDYGKVMIAGFGPGNPELLTLKALHAMQEADVIYYDDLIDHNFLNQFACKREYVGKRKKHHSKTQEEINDLLFQSAIQGKNVVRLKGGDPQIFGRGGEEFDFLARRLIHTEIIPGVTSALAAAAYAGIPLTMRDESASVAFCTGFPKERITVPNADTLVYYMAASSLNLIVEKVIAAGRKPGTPVALIENASSSAQKIAYSTLDGLLKNGTNLKSPLVVIIGEHIRNKNTSKTSKVLVTGSSPEHYEYLGNVVHTSFVEIAPLDDYNKYKEKFSENNLYDWVIFTNRFSVSFFIRALNESGKDIRWLGNSKIIAVGNITTRELKKYGLIPDMVSHDESSAGIIEMFIDYHLSGNKILLPCSNITKDTLSNHLKRLGFDVDSLVVYNNREPEYIYKINLDDIDIVAFSSPSGVKNFKQIYDKIPDHVSVVSRGKQTKETLYQTGLLKEDNDWVI